ncbi:hypothetical protein BO85DRAFT_244995 [Aspergillus piperis CBS 112811]|uniref:Uncharacterized protein n=1 Tax=Aspergillus piperis CBS 112811 TaxID=1448313 RepID=A0A8G1VP76_9EURO|nr:hypothetical protein BO85DRAFT_244995 [Aspergillus piperis CBS 112811]RAH59555.1 hypothetical protein BO85DRAFT_244995 [Aspergillus piperis CBS 112811]
MAGMCHSCACSRVRPSNQMPTRCVKNKNQMQPTQLILPTSNLTRTSCHSAGKHFSIPPSFPPFSNVCT